MINHKRLAKTLIRTRANRVQELGDEELERQAVEFMAKQKDQTSGAKQRASGRKSPGRRGKYGVSSETLPDAWRDAVRRLKRQFHQLPLDEDRCEADTLPELFCTIVREVHRVNPTLTWHCVCGIVGAQVFHPDKDRGRKAYTAQTVMKATREFKWSDPRTTR